MTYSRGKFTIVSPEDLPELPWLPRCPLARPLGPKLTEVGGADADSRWRAAEANMVASEFRACELHGTNAALAAEMAVAAFRSSARLDDDLIGLIAAKNAAATESVTALAMSYFDEPIFYNATHGIYSEGLHRACALKHSGAPVCIVKKPNH